MALYKTYQGSFVSRMGNVIRCEIWCNATTAPDSVGELTFPYDAPLTIEWDADSKRETIQGSTATLTVESPGDRTYIGLYTTVPGSVQLRVYSNNALWWSGTLDPEHYEEPFSMQRNYDVTFTFTDFGILPRLAYNLLGVQSLDSIFNDAISRCTLATSSYTPYIATTAKSDNAQLWTIRSDNFTDEDGESMTLADVLEAVMQPLDLHIRQHLGHIYIFDLHSLSSRTATLLTWDSDDQVLSVDEVANSVRVTFSPYAEAKVMEADKMLQYTGNVTVDDFAHATTQHFLTLEGGTSSDHATTRAWYPDYGDHSSGASDQDYANLSFGLYTSQTYGAGYLYKAPTLEVARFLPLLGSEDTTCLLVGYRVSGHTKSSQTSQSKGSYSTDGSVNLYAPLAKFRGGIVAPDPNLRTRIKLTLSLLYDVRYNFTSNPDDNNTQGAYDYMANRSNATYIPVAILLRDAQGNVTHHYRNLSRCSGTVVDHYFAYDLYSSSQCGWVEGDPTTNPAIPVNQWPCWLCYYQNTDERARGNAATDGFTPNRHAIGVNGTGTLPESYKQRNSGELLLPPPVAGTIEVWVYRGVLPYDYNQNQQWGEIGTISRQWLGDNIRWYAFTAPSIDIVANNIKFTDIGSEDIEYTGTLIESAQDEISIDTKCGSDASIPGARGIYMDSHGQPIATASRNNRTDSVEQLLIGTLHSHYASRHIRLTGTIHMDSLRAWGPLFDRTVGSSVKFALTSAVCDIRADEVEATLIETSPDNYTS